MGKTIIEILKRLNVPEDKWERRIDVYDKAGIEKNYFSSVLLNTWGGDSHRVYDPYNQLEEVAQKEMDPMVFGSGQRGNVTTLRYKGENIAAVTHSSSGPVYGGRSWFDLFIPEDLKILWAAKEKETVVFRIPVPLAKKWILQACEIEGRNPEDWQIYARVCRKAEDKAYVYAAYQYAKKYSLPGIIYDLFCSYQDNGFGSQEKCGTSIFVHNGKVEFVDSPDWPEYTLLTKDYPEFNRIEINFPEIKF